MAGMLDRLKGVGETALDYLTPDILFGNVGKVGHRRPHSIMDAAAGVSPIAPDMGGQAPAQDTPMPAIARGGGSGQKFKNGLGILDRVLGGQTITDAMESQRQVQANRAAEPERKAYAAQTAGMVDALVKSGGLTPQEAVAFRTDPKAFSALIEDRYKPQVASPESSVFINGQFQQAPAAAPAPVKPEKKPEPQIIQGKDGIYEYDPVTRKTKQLTGWAAFAPRAARSGAGGGGDDAPPSGFVLD